MLCDILQFQQHQFHSELKAKSSFYSTTSTSAILLTERFIVAGTPSGDLHFWNKNIHSIKKLSDNRGGVLALCITAQQKLAVGRRAAIALCDSESGKLFSTYMLKTSENRYDVNQLVQRKHGGAEILVAVDDGQLGIVDVREAEPVMTLRVGTPCYAIAELNDEAVAATGEDGIIKMYDLRNTKKHLGILDSMIPNLHSQTVPKTRGFLNTLVEDGGGYLYASGKHQIIHKWYYRDGLWSAIALDCTPVCFVLDEYDSALENASRIVVGSNDGYIRHFNKQNEKMISKLSTALPVVKALASIGASIEEHMMVAAGIPCIIECWCNPWRLDRTLHFEEEFL